MLDQAIITTLRDIFSADNLLTEPGDCWAYGYDNSKAHGPVEAVVFPHRADQVIALVQCCAQARIPLIARGRGTGTCGGSVPTVPSIVCSFERMSQLLSIDTANRMAIVEPGLLNQDLQIALGKKGFFWAPEPSSSAYCTIGGNLAYNSAGPRTLKYGTPRDNTLGLQVVTGSAQLLNVGVKTSKGVVGYDLTRLLIGSEGTLGLITQATLKITPLQPARALLQAFYSSVHGAGEAIAAIMNQSITPYALEFMDHRSLKLIRQYHPHLLIPENAQAMLFIEIDGAVNTLSEQLNSIESIAKQGNCIRIEQAISDEEQKALWAIRQSLSPTLRSIAPQKINEDIVVPVANLPRFIEQTQQLGEQYDLTIVNFGHAGNGNIHVNLLIDPNNPDEKKRAYACLNDIFSLVIDLEGTLSGEHGVGLAKQPFIRRELSEEHIHLMAQIKHCFDPSNILNPHKIW